jgi:hypothetical protein
VPNTPALRDAFSSVAALITPELGDLYSSVAASITLALEDAYFGVTAPITWRYRTFIPAWQRLLRSKKGFIQA